jgi:predicted amidohydrolase
MASKEEKPMAAPYDLLLKGGTLLDPSQDLHQRCDVAFRHGRVAAFAPDLLIDAAREVIDVTGNLITPGLIDIHGHFFYRGWPGAVDPDAACLPAGVTTAVDAGSTGWGNFPALREGLDHGVGHPVPFGLAHGSPRWTERRWRYLDRCQNGSKH